MLQGRTAAAHDLWRMGAGVLRELGDTHGLDMKRTSLPTAFEEAGVPVFDTILE